MDRSKKESKKARELSFAKMVHFIKDNGKTITLKGLEEWSMNKVMFMKAFGPLDRLKDKGLNTG
jgi:hypothetical protein